MRTITAIGAQQGNKRRVNVHLDGEYAFSLDAFLAAKEDVSIGRSLTEEALAELAREDEYHRCLDAALRFLGYRPRSEAEVRRRLCKRGFTESTIGEVLLKLRSLQFLDDATFARFWIDNRQSFNPRSERLLKFELRQKGVDADTVTGLIEIDESEAAYRAAQKKLRSVADCDLKEFRQRLASFLQRRGFGYETVSEVVARLWKERQASNQR